MQRSALRHSSSIFAPVVTGSVYFIVATMALLISRFEGGLAFIWGANAFLMAELYKEALLVCFCALLQ